MSDNPHGTTNAVPPVENFTTVPKQPDPRRYLDLDSPDAERRLAAKLREKGAVFGVAPRYGKFNDAYYDDHAANILAALRKTP